MAALLTRCRKQLARALSHDKPTAAYDNGEGEPFIHHRRCGVFPNFGSLGDGPMLHASHRVPSRVSWHDIFANLHTNQTKTIAQLHNCTIASQKPSPTENQAKAKTRNTTIHNQVFSFNVPNPSETGNAQSLNSNGVGAVTQKL
jgi:hypothetical protein